MLSIYGVVDFMDFKTDVQVDSDIDTLLTHVTLTQGKISTIFSKRGTRYSGIVEGLPSQQAGPKSVTVGSGCLRGHRVQAFNQNPFILTGQNGDEIPSTKLLISDIPLSCANEDIESALSRLAVVLRSKLIQEKK